MPDFQLSCAGCSSRFSHSHERNSEFLFRESREGGQVFDLRDLLQKFSNFSRVQRKNSKPHNPARWGSGQKALLLLLVDIFGENFPLIANFLPHFAPNFLKTKYTLLKPREAMMLGPHGSEDVVSATPNPSERMTPTRPTLEQSPTERKLRNPVVWQSPAADLTPFRNRFLTPNSFNSPFPSFLGLAAPKKSNHVWGNLFEEPAIEAVPSVLDQVPPFVQTSKENTVERPLFVSRHPLNRDPAVTLTDQKTTKRWRPMIEKI